MQASGGFSGAEKATPSSRSFFTRNGVCLFGWKPLDARRGQRPKPSERRRQPPKCCTTPTTGCSPCAADCTGRLTVGMTRDFADGEARTAAASRTCGTSGVLPVNMERPSGSGVRTGSRAGELERSSWLMPMNLRLRCMIARSTHRAADISVETETQFGPVTSRPERGAKSHQPAFGVAASDTLAVQSGDEAGERLRPDARAVLIRIAALAIGGDCHDLGGSSSAGSEHSFSLPLPARIDDAAGAGLAPCLQGCNDMGTLTAPTPASCRNSIRCRQQRALCR